MKKEREEKEMEYKNDIQRKQNQIIVLKNNSDLLQRQIDEFLKQITNIKHEILKQKEIV